MDIDLLLAAIALVIIIALAFYAGKLLHKIKRLTLLNLQIEEQKKTEVDLKKQQRNNRICESIRLIAQATAQKQCNVSEAAIRLTVLLETLLIEQAIDTEQEYPALSALFHKIKDMPTHEQRKKVASKKLKILDRQRQVFESELEAAIIKEVSRLKTFAL